MLSPFMISTAGD